MLRNNPTGATFALKMVMERYKEGWKELHFVFVDLEEGSKGRNGGPV